MKHTIVKAVEYYRRHPNELFFDVVSVIALFALSYVMMWLPELAR